jgi:hypothetical protein
VEALWKRQTAAERSGYVRLIARRAAGATDGSRSQRTARPLQAGGRPFEPGTAHTPGPGLRRGTAAGTSEHCCLSRGAGAASRTLIWFRDLKTARGSVSAGGGPAR